MVLFVVWGGAERITTKNHLSPDYKVQAIFYKSSLNDEAENTSFASRRVKFPRQWFCEGLLSPPLAAAASPERGTYFPSHRRR